LGAQSWILPLISAGNPAAVAFIILSLGERLLGASLTGLPGYPPTLDSACHGGGLPFLKLRG
jgi:hypothetical protein